MKKSLTAPDSSRSLKVSMFWGDILYDTVICAPRQSIRLGRRPGVTFVMDLSPKVLDNDGTLELVRVNPDQTAEVKFHDEIDGHLRFGQKLLSLRNSLQTDRVFKDSSGFYRAKLESSDKADFVIGHVSFYLDWVEKHHAVERSNSLSKRQLISGFLMLLLFIGLFGALSLIQTEPETPPERLVTILPRTSGGKASVGETKTADGGAQKGDSGKAELKIQEKPSVVAALKSANLGSVVQGLSAVGSNAPSASSDANANSHARVQQTGTGGFSTAGLKNGGGGSTVGIGRATGKGEGGFEGTGRLGLSGNSDIEGGTGDGAGGAVTRGGLDRDVIESIIKRRLDRIRLCYERQLNFNPKLRGKIGVHFVIGKAGEVMTSAASEDTMKNEAVRKCVLAEVKSWTFPNPEGGTFVNVDYPFMFESSAQAN